MHGMNETTGEVPTPPPVERERLVEALRLVYDPEIPVNIYDLGLVYDIGVQDGGHVHVRMTLTTPHCPEAATIPLRVEAVLRDVPGVAGARAEVVWDPPWTPERMTEAARLQLGMEF